MAPLPKKSMVDYGDVEIKKLPPGEAFGARDLQMWSHNRNLGRFGTGTTQNRALTLQCKSCGAISEVLGIQVKPHRARRGKFDCRHCGKPDARIVKAKRLRAV